MGFDIGLKKVNQLISISAQRSQRKYVELHWACDMVVVWNIGDVAPVLDENMMRIYADVYRRDITNLNDEQLKELATSYQQAIKVFVYQNLFNAISKITRRWRSLAEGNNNYPFSIPTNSLTMFDNLLLLHKQNPDADDTLQFNAFKSSLLRNSEEWFQTWNQDFDISKYLIPQERFLLFMDIVDKKIRECFQKTNSNDSIAVDYHTKIQSVIEYLKVLLLIAHQAKIERKEDILKLPSILYRWGWLKQETREAASRFALKYGTLRMTHLICLDTDTDLNLPIPQADISNVETLETLYAYTKYVQDHLILEDN